MYLSGIAPISVRQTHRSSLILFSVTLLLLSTVFLFYRHRDDLQDAVTYHIKGWERQALIQDAANATLGFEKVFALSTGVRWRVSGIRAAAKLTGIDLEIPRQPFTPSDIVEAFRHIGPEDGRHPSEGSAKAWIAHLDLLKHIVQGGWSSALIMEDDADWDVRIRDDIMVPLAKGVRNYTQASEDDIETPFGGNWDVLWMGHCGQPVEDKESFHAWPDATVLPQDQYLGWAAMFYRNRTAEGVRVAHPTSKTVCTFAYGTTAKGAFKILQTIGDGIGEAFDVELSHACYEKRLSCVTLLPEIFHHYIPPKEYGDTSQISEINHDEQPTTDPVIHMGSTANIERSARCEALFQQTCQEMPS